MSKLKLHPDYIGNPWTNTTEDPEKILKECARWVGGGDYNVNGDLNKERWKLLARSNKMATDLTYEINEARILCLKIYHLDMLAFDLGSFNLPTFAEATEYELKSTFGDFSVSANGYVYWYGVGTVKVDTTALRRSVRAFQAEQRKLKELNLKESQVNALEAIATSLNKNPQ